MVAAGRDGVMDGRTCLATRASTKPQAVPTEKKQLPPGDNAGGFRKLLGRGRGELRAEKLPLSSPPPTPPPPAEKKEKCEALPKATLVPKTQL